MDPTQKTLDSARLIRELALQPHPEGGYYRETYRAAAVDAAGRCASTMIYFLLERGQVSRLHRIDADEGWHLYLGGPLRIIELDERASESPPEITVLGSDLEHGERPQHLVLAGRWFGAELVAGAPYALVGCTVAPGFEFARFELGRREFLEKTFPAAAEIIRYLT